jgi:hypothetical protein
MHPIGIKLRVCYVVAPFLTRGRICSLLLLLVLVSAVPLDSRPYFIVPILETPQTWTAKSPYLYPPETECPSYTPEHWVLQYSALTTLPRAALYTLNLRIVATQHVETFLIYPSVTKPYSKRVIFSVMVLKFR